MGVSVRASDWEFAGVATIGGGAVVGAAAFWFDFRSRSAGVRETFLFAGAGLAIGGSAGGVSLPNRSGDPDYSSISSIRAFSVEDLNCSLGRVDNIGVSLVVGIGFTYIYAHNRSGGLFEDQGGFGFSGGVGAGATSMTGIWYSTTLATASTNRR